MPMEINESKVKKAFRALYKHVATNEESKDEETVWLMVTTYRVNERLRGNPTRIVLKHGCQTPGVHRCLFTKTDQEKYKTMLREKKVKGIHKVIDLKHLKKQHSTKEAKQKLLDQFDMFIAESNCIKLLYHVLGKDVYKKRREPIPVDLRKTDVQKEVLRAAKSTYMNFHTGSCYAVKIATIAQADTEAYENFMGAYKKIALATPGGEEAIRSFQIKTANSISLPLYEAETDFKRDVLYEEDE